MIRSIPTYLLILGLLFFERYYSFVADKQQDLFGQDAIQQVQADRPASLTALPMGVNLLQVSLFSDDKDDDEFTSSRKKIAAHRSFASLIYILFPCSHFGFLKSPPRFCRNNNQHISDKYIFQRTLRV